MPASIVYLRHRRPVDYGVTPGSTTFNRSGRPLFERFSSTIHAAHGDGVGDSEYAVGYSSTDIQCANSGLSVSGASGTVGIVANGVTVTVTHATSDTNDAALIAAAINASVNSLVLGYLTSNNLSATITLTSVAAGQTVQVGSSVFTATTGVHANLTSMATVGTFDISGNDTADALALARAINICPVTNRYFFAVSVAGVVRVFAAHAVYTLATNTFAWPSGPRVPPNTITSQATTMVVSTNGVAAAAFVGLLCPIPGISGNAVTIAASGTGIAVLNTETRLNRGTGPTTLVTGEC